MRRAVLFAVLLSCTSCPPIERATDAGSTVVEVLTAGGALPVDRYLITDGGVRDLLQETADKMTLVCRTSDVKACKQARERVMDFKAALKKRDP